MILIIMKKSYSSNIHLNEANVLIFKKKFFFVASLFINQYEKNESPMKRFKIDTEHGEE